MNDLNIPDNTPVLVGCAQITQREPDPAIARGPGELIADVAKQALNDAGPAKQLTDALDTIVVIRSFSHTSWRFASPFGDDDNAPKSLATRLNAPAVRRHIYTEPGGNMPQWCVNRLSEQIRAGEVGAALIAGGEALATQKAARRAKLTLDWKQTHTTKPTSWGVDKRGWSDLEDRHGMRGAIYAYPLIEAAIRHHKGHTIEQHQQAIGELLAGFAQVAANNPLADRRDGYTASQIATVGPDNPMIGFPYTRLMNANAYIDQSAALVMTSAGKARAMGVPREQWVFLHGYADAHDHWYLTERAELHKSEAMPEVYEAAFEMAGASLQDMAMFDLYSCFSSAVQAACDSLGLAPYDKRGLTVTGGLPYFGGPGNNYVTHAIAETVQRLRQAPGDKGLVTANGNYLTKHSAGIYSTEPNGKAPTEAADLQPALDALPKVEIAELAEGSAEIESYTVMHDREGPASAIVLGRLDNGQRFIANTDDDKGLWHDMERKEWIGHKGRVTNDGQCNRLSV
ncbi:MAG: acetyl-CoA acetyltransferase [Burkholderiaceae bacterium]